LLGDLVAVLCRVVVVRRFVFALRRVVLLRAAGLRVDPVVRFVVVLSAIAGISPFCVGP
jgi:hypothetical protein